MRLTATWQCQLGVKSLGFCCTTQMVALTMMALALSEDSIRLRARRNDIIDALGSLPDQIREARSLVQNPYTLSFPNNGPALASLPDEIRETPF